MKRFNLKRLLRKRQVAFLLEEMMAIIAVPVAVMTEDGELLFGVYAPDMKRIALKVEEETCGWVMGNGTEAEGLATLITHLVLKELEKTALAQDGLDNYREINLLYDIGERIFSCQNHVEIARLVTVELHRFVKSDNISVMLYCEENDILNILAATGVECDLKTVLRKGEGIAGSVMVSGKAEIVNDIDSDPRYVHGVNIVGSLMCVPLNAKKSCLGVINISRKEVMDFSARDLRLAIAITSQTAIAIENAQLYDHLLDQNKTLEGMVAARTEELNATLVKVKAANHIIRQTFGRYLSEDVVDDILSSPDGAALGGESRMITIMMTDLRGFTSISERLPAKDVLNIVNIYLEKMTEVIIKYNGTIIEFIGDAILAVFGAPILREDDAKRGVACAIEMQNVMAEVNVRCRELGYPEIKQGIGINTGESVVGNIGSDKRTKYGLVGRNVNLTGRIESYTVGGQILISENTANACGPVLEIHQTLEIMPKGVDRPIILFDVVGMRGDFNVSLSCVPTSELIELNMQLPIGFMALEGKYATKKIYDGSLIRLGSSEAVICSESKPELLENLKLTMFDGNGNEVTSNLYAKVIESPSGIPPAFKVNFTSISPEARAYLDEVMLRNNKELAHRRKFH